MICKKAFFSSNGLTYHERVHTDEKLYECVICKKTFSSSNTLAYPERVHTGEKPYKCVICKKVFISSEHKRVHTGEKPYSCDVCQKSFSQSSTLSTHNKTAAHIERMKCKNIYRDEEKSSVIHDIDIVKHRIEPDIK